MDKKDNIIVVDTANSIFRYNEQNREWAKLSRSKFVIFGLVFSKNNDCYAVTDSGIVDLKSNLRYYPDTLFGNNHYKIYWEGGSRDYPIIKIDHNDDIWVGFDYGEWEGDIYKFDTKLKQYIKLDLIGNPNCITSIAESENRIYYSAGTEHYGMGCGRISSFANNEEQEIYSDKFELNRKSKWNLNDEFIAQINFCQNDGSLYAYSQFGIFKSNPESEFRDSVYWINIIPLNLNWLIKHKMENADIQNNKMIQLRLTKMEVLNQNHIILASSHQGIGIYNGKQMIFVRPKSVNDRARMIVELK